MEEELSILPLAATDESDTDICRLFPRCWQIESKISGPLPIDSHFSENRHRLNQPMLQ